MWQLLQHTLKPDLETLLPPFLFARILPLRSSSEQFIFFFIFHPAMVLFNPATVLRNPATVLRRAGLRFEVRKENVKTAMSRSPKVTQIGIWARLKDLRLQLLQSAKLKNIEHFETDFGTGMTDDGFCIGIMNGNHDPGSDRMI